MCYTSRKDNHDERATFLWGTADEVAARARFGRSTFRLCREGGALPPVAQVFDFVPAFGTQPVTRFGQPVADLWSDGDADYCFMAGVTPPDRTAPRSS